MEMYNKDDMLSEPISGNMILGDETVEEKKKREDHFKKNMILENGFKIGALL